MFSLELISKQLGLRFDISVEDAVAVHVFNGFQQLVNVVLDFGFSQIGRSALNGLVQVHLHDFEDERQTTSWLVVKHLNELDDVSVR